MAVPPIHRTPKGTMRTGTKRRLQLTCRIILAGTLVGVAYSSLLNFAAYGTPGLGMLIGAIHGFILSATIGSMETFGTRTLLGRAVEQAPLLVTLAVKGLVYGSLIALVNVVEPGTRLLGLRPGPRPVQLVSLVFSFVVTLAFIFLLQVSQIVGSRIFRGLLFGRYHRPRSEERFFLFVDIVGSTTLAERIGPVGVHQFLNRVFVLAADQVDDYRGEIYQYVGDEMVITWADLDGRRDARPIGCFVAIEAALNSAASDFTRDFGVAPRIRGALHAGPVIVGEVGARKRDIVFHGDVMNTTARLEQIARELDRRLVISGDALSRLEGAQQFASEDLGDRVLRGRTTPVRIFAVAEAVHSPVSSFIDDRP
jgi:adenylate cyclase